MDGMDGMDEVDEVDAMDKRGGNRPRVPVADQRASL
jgi:hypothetical protein